MTIEIPTLTYVCEVMLTLKIIINIVKIKKL